MKNFIRKQRVRNLDDLKVCIIQYWKKLTPDACQKYIAGVRKRMKQVAEQQGRNIVE
ncbi:hypothetical protein ANCCAN_08928 [Ancylostoma caninum]|nr:hypothetical protein ANCCAN_08928 [Ancylostoma caninum]